VIIIPEKEIEYHDWVGIGYIVEDTETGNGGDMISGGLRGGETAEGMNRARWETKVSQEDIEEFTKDMLDWIAKRYGGNSYKLIKAQWYIATGQWKKLILLLDPTPKEWQLIMKYAGLLVDLGVSKITKECLVLSDLRNYMGIYIESSDEYSLSQICNHPSKYGGIIAAALMYYQEHGKLPNWVKKTIPDTILYYLQSTFSIEIEEEDK